eukprot:COSAG02_NODE_10141_length_2012_cov_2.083638_1_plen_32_part_10
MNDKLFRTILKRYEAAELAGYSKKRCRQEGAE